MSVTITGGITMSGGGTSMWPPPSAGQQEYTTPGTYSWTCPQYVTSVCVVCVGGGGSGQYRSNYSSTLLAGGGGGGLGYKNNIPVIPGQTYTVFVGAGTPSASAPSGTGTTNPATAAQDSYFISTSVVKGGAGQNASSATGGGGAGGHTLVMVEALVVQVETELDHLVLLVVAEEPEVILVQVVPAEHPVMVLLDRVAEAAEVLAMTQASTQDQHMQPLVVV